MLRFFVKLEPLEFKSASVSTYFKLLLQVKKASAATEKAWENAGKRPGIQIWRVVKFKVSVLAPKLENLPTTLPYTILYVATFPLIENLSSFFNFVFFQITHWPKEEYGKFFNGDSYIILRTYKKQNSDVGFIFVRTV